MIDSQTIQELIVQLTWITPIVIALVAVLRVTFKISERFLPITSLFVGIAFSLLFVGLSVIGLAVGIVIGLSASGLYDFGKKTVLNA